MTPHPDAPLGEDPEALRQHLVTVYDAALAAAPDVLARGAVLSEILAATRRAR